MLMEEIHRNQESLISSISRENELFEQLEYATDLAKTITKAKLYQQKLVDIKRNMLLIKDRTTRLKRLASKLIEDRNRDIEEMQRTRERREILERHLEPVVNTRTDT